MNLRTVIVSLTLVATVAVNFPTKAAWNLVQLEESNAIIVRKLGTSLNIANPHRSQKGKFEALQTTKRISTTRMMNTFLLLTQARVTVPKHK